MSSIFDLPGRFYRGCLHTHSDQSDGQLAPAEVCRRYQANGYDFVSITDHFIGTYAYPITHINDCNSDSFNTIPGAELHSGAMQNGEIWHLLAVGLPDDFPSPNSPDFKPRSDQETGPQIARRAADAGAYVVIAHPQWSGLTMDDARSINSAHAVEIYNHSCQVDCDRGDGFCTYDLLLSEGRNLQLCATDDAHFASNDHFGGWVMVKAEQNTPQALVEALKAGHHYSSQGPDFRRIDWHGDQVQITSSAVSAVMVQGAGSASVVTHGESMMNTTLLTTRLAQSDWARIVIVDAAGKRAFSQPYWRNDSGYFQ